MKSFPKRYKDHFTAVSLQKVSKWNIRNRLSSAKTDIDKSNIPRMKACIVNL